MEVKLSMREEAREIVEQVAHQIDKDIHVVPSGGKSFYEDTFEMLLIKGERTRSVVVTKWGITHAKRDTADLEKVIRNVWETGTR
jgi:hypothetical protein